MLHHSIADRLSMSSRGIITLAFGRTQYIEQAKALARSLILHDPTVMRAIITDSKDPELGDLFTYRIDLRPEYGSGLRQKMHLDRYSPFDQTLFLDCNSLVVRNLDAFWQAFHTASFGVCASDLPTPNATGVLDLAPSLHSFRFSNLPRFNSALYYFKPSPEAKAFFTTARSLLSRAIELDLAPSDQTLYSIAMAIHGLTVTAIDPLGIDTLLDSTGLTLDVPKGLCTFLQLGRRSTPAILHLAHFDESLFYLRECSRLEHRARGISTLTRSEQLQLSSSAAILWTRRHARTLRQSLQDLFSFPTPTFFPASVNAPRLSPKPARAAQSPSPLPPSSSLRPNSNSRHSSSNQAAPAS
jgi:hypothetical protein